MSGFIAHSKTGAVGILGLQAGEDVKICAMPDHAPKTRRGTRTPKFIAARAEARRLVQEWDITPVELMKMAEGARWEHEKSLGSVIRHAKQLVDFWGMTARELSGIKYERGARAAAVKYRHPQTGDVWNGEGAQPDWLRRALLREGYLLSELAPEEGADSASADSADESA
jgi:DNA-binding protein H-NS